MTKLLGKTSQVVCANNGLPDYHQNLTDNIAFRLYVNLADKFGCVEDTENDIIGKISGNIKSCVIDWIEHND